MTPATFRALSLAPAKSIKIPTSKEKGAEMSEGLFHSIVDGFQTLPWQCPSYVQLVQSHSNKTIKIVNCWGNEHPTRMLL